MRFGNFKFGEDHIVAAIRIRIDVQNIGAQPFNLVVNRLRRLQSSAYFKRNNTPFPSRKSSPNDCLPLFFLTKV
jgi:hypothetical protein